MFHSCSSSNKELMIRRTFLVFSIIVFIAAPHVRGECTCVSEQGGKGGDGNNTKQALKLKLGAIGSILGFGAFGVCLPLLSKISPGHAFLFMIKAFAAGVILATGFIHILPDAFDHLSSPCLKEKPWGDFPFTGFIAMMAAIGTLMVDTIATSYYKMMHSSKVDNSSNGVVVGDEEKISGEHAGHGHGHGHVHDSHGTHGHGPIEESISMGSIDLIRHRVISQVLELGIVVHSVVIGISLGASETPSTIRTLLIALSFHQFFEGMGLGGCISQAKFKSRAIVVMALFFACTTPVGIAIGIGISNVYDKNSSTAIIVEGCLNSASAGILIYMALVDLLAADFMSDRVQSSGKLQVQVYVCLLAGAASMSLLATWA